MESSAGLCALVVLTISIPAALGGEKTSTFRSPGAVASANFQGFTDSGRVFGYVAPATMPDPSYFVNYTFCSGAFCQGGGGFAPASIVSSEGFKWMSVNVPNLLELQLAFHWASDCSQPACTPVQPRPAEFRATCVLSTGGFWFVNEITGETVRTYGNSAPIPTVTFRSAGHELFQTANCTASVGSVQLVPSPSASNGVMTISKGERTVHFTMTTTP